MKIALELVSLSKVRGPQPHDKTINHHHADQFPLTEAYTMLLRKMSLTHDPYAKLHSLYELGIEQFDMAFVNHIVLPPLIDDDSSSQSPIYTHLIEYQDQLYSVRRSV